MQTRTCVLVGLLCAACSTSVPEPNVTVSQTVKPASQTSPSGTVAGYVHTLAASRFQIGTAVYLETNDATIQRWRGSLGAFALDPTNGASMALLDASSPKGPYILDDATQAAQVQAYFVGAGIPADQVAAVKATYTVAGGGQMGAPETQPIQLQSINSVLARSINGIPVVESYAAARMTTAGDVDWEAVFWPPIDSAVVEKAVALAAKMADPTAHAAYVGKLGATIYHDGGVVIHHSTPAIHSTPVAFVSYDATTDSDSMAADRHFDENGVAFALPQETLQSAVPSTRSSKR